MDLQYILIIIAVVIVVLLFLFRKQIGRYSQSLFHDYVYDAFLSFLDEPLGGAASVSGIPLDWGDLIGAIMIFRAEKKVMGAFVAFIVAWEAVTFFPVSTIPIFGKFFGFALNFCPTVTIARFFASKYGTAEKLEHTLEEEEDLLKKEHVKVPDLDDAIKHAKKLIEEQNPVAAVAMEKAIDKAITKKLRTQVDKLVKQVEAEIKQVVEQQPEGSVEIMQVLQTGISNSQSLLEEAKTLENKKQFRESLQKAKDAQKALEDTVNFYNEETDE